MLAGYAANVGVGIKLDLSGLSKREKKALIKFIARVSEVSYRRGFQQAYVMRDRIEIYPYKLRYERNIDKAPWGETGRCDRTAIDILRVEYWQSFESIGLPIPRTNPLF